MLFITIREERGVDPEVMMVEQPGGERAGAMAVIPERKAAVESALIGPWLRRGDEDRVRGIVEQHFDDLFAEVEGGSMRRLSEAAKPMLITWDTA